MFSFLLKYRLIYIDEYISVLLYIIFSGLSIEK